MLEYCKPLQICRQEEQREVSQSLLKIPVMEDLHYYQYPFRLSEYEKAFHEGQTGHRTREKRSTHLSSHSDHGHPAGIALSLQPKAHAKYQAPQCCSWHPYVRSDQLQSRRVSKSHSLEWSRPDDKRLIDWLLNSGTKILEYSFPVDPTSFEIVGNEIANELAWKASVELQNQRDEPTLPVALNKLPSMAVLTEQKEANDNDSALLGPQMGKL